MKLSKSVFLLGLAAGLAALAPKAMSFDSSKSAGDVTLIAEGVQTAPTPSNTPSLMVVAGTSGTGSTAQWVSSHGHLALHETIKPGASAGFAIYPQSGGQLPSQVSTSFSQCDVKFSAVNSSGVDVGVRSVQFRYIVSYTDGTTSSGIARHVGGAYVVPANQPKTRWATVKSIVVIGVARPGITTSSDGAPGYIVNPIQSLPLLDPLLPINSPGVPLADLIEPDLKTLIDLGYTGF